MSKRKLMIKMKLPVLALLVVLFGCSSPLLEVIEEEVEVVVTPPSVSTLYPEPDSTSVAIDIDNIVITFSKSINGSSVNSSTIVITDQDDAGVSGAFTTSGETISFNPSNDLAYGTTYTVSIKTGLKDINGNSISSDFSWSFSTIDPPSEILPSIEDFRIDYGRSATNSSTVTLDIVANNGVGISGGMEFRYRATSSDTWSSWISLTENTGLAEDIVIPTTSGVSEYFEFEAEVQNELNYKSDIMSDSILYEEDPPAVLEKTPSAGSIDYPSNGGIISISFSEPIDPNTITSGPTGNFYIMNGTTRIDGTGVIYIEEDSSNQYPNNTVLLTGFELDQGVDYLVYLESSAADIAGNTLESDESWFFRTGDAIDDEPPTGSIVLDSSLAKHPTETATNNVVAELVIEAIDSYNIPYGMKIWGDNNDAGLPAFEDDASWEPYGTSKTWTLSNLDGFKYIYYKFMDAASNETETPYRLKISLDTTAPTITNIYLDNGSEYTNNTDETVNLVIDAEDQTSGLAKVKVTVDSVELILDPDDEDGDADTIWGSWQPSMEIPLSSGDGLKTIEVDVKDYVGLPNATTATETITLDTVPPQISFDEADFLYLNSQGTQTGTFTDANPIPATGGYQWEQISGPSGGTVLFEDADDEHPLVSADIEGLYTLQITVTDPAGNSSFDRVDMVWDTTKPGTPPGAAPVVTVAAFYSNDPQPKWSWNTLEGANYYRVSFAGSPNWDFLDPTGQTGYIQTEETSFTPSFDLAEGNHNLKVKGYDFAGNETNVGNNDIFVDTINPVISNDGSYFLRNGLFPVNNSGNVSDSGSGLASYNWYMDSGPGTITFSDSNSAVTNISASTDGLYFVHFTATDNAGNSFTAEYVLDWDTTGPTAPAISAPVNTPDSTPTWNWESSGDGIGDYRYEFIDKNSTSSGWITTSSNSFTPTDQLEGQYTLTLNLQDQDEAGNWSSTSTHVINVDTTNIVAPFITSVSATNDSTPTWTWTSGAGADPTADYKWKLDGGSWSSTTSQTSYTPGSALSHGLHTLYVEETYNSIQRESSRQINVDLIPPNPPNVSMTQTGTSTTYSNDTTPNFTWSAGTGDGVGIFQYQYRINGGALSGWSSETTSTSYTYTTSLVNGNTFELQVRERDQLGNWSNAGTKIITIDTVAPILTSVTIRDPSPQTYDTNNLYTNTTSVFVDIIGDVSSEGDDVTLTYLDYNPVTAYETWGSPFETDGNMTISTVLPSTNGTRKVYAQLVDSAGNGSSYRNDSITLDTVSPSISSFSINGNNASTASTSVTLNSSVSGASYMHVRNGSSGSYTEYNYSTTKSWYLNSGYGAKRVEIYYEDAAGNTSSATSDMIHYGQTTLYNSTKGETNNGYIYLNYNSYGSEYGSNVYYAYFHTSPTSTPDVGFEFYRQSSSTAPLYTGIPKGELYYVYIRMYNNSGAGWSDRYSNYMIAFSSNITVIYDSLQTSDVTTATNIKNVLEKTSFNPDGISSISGTMPTWTVTLVPENEVSNSWTTTDDRYIIYGDPIIITPHASLPYSYPNRARNIAHRSSNTGLLPTTTNSKAGIVAMGYGGSLFLYRLRLNPSWHWSGTMNDTYQYPTEIGYGFSTGFNTSDVFMYQWTAGNSTWSSPLASTTFNGGTNPAHNVTTQITYNTAPLATAGTTDAYKKRWSVNRPTDSNPTYGYIYGGDYPNQHYFPVIRQGRFLQFGFPVLPNRAYTGYVYFVNLIARMDNY